MPLNWHSKASLDDRGTETAELGTNLIWPRVETGACFLPPHVDILTFETTPFLNEMEYHIQWSFHLVGTLFRSIVYPMAPKLEYGIELYLSSLNLLTIKRKFLLRFEFVFLRVEN